MVGTRNVSEKLSAPGKDGAKNAFATWQESNTKIKLGTFAETAQFADIVLNTTKGLNSLDVLKLATEKNLENKLLVNISNPLDFSKSMPPCLVTEFSNTIRWLKKFKKHFQKLRL